MLTTFVWKVECVTDRHKHTPLRTCIATRQLQPQHTLLRCVVEVAERDDGHDGQNTLLIVPDPKRRKPGRGAWIQPTLDAWEIAEKRRAFARALKVSASAADAKPVRDYIASQSNTEEPVE